VATSQVRLPPGPALRDLAEAARGLLALRSALAVESAQLIGLRDTLLPGLVLGAEMSPVSNVVIAPLDQCGLH
jgi:hypothetical protein